MKIAYLLSWPLETRGSIERKVEMQIGAWREAGHEVQVHVICGESGVADYIDGGRAELYRKSSSAGIWSKFRAAELAFRRAAREIRRSGAELVYYRMSYPTSAVRKLAEALPLVVEINNYTPQEIRRNFGGRPIFGRLLAAYVKVAYPRLFRRAAGIVGVTGELIEVPETSSAACPKICIPNAVDLRDIDTLPPREETGGKPVVVFLGGSEHPEGVRRILDLAAASTEDLEFRLIGKNFPDDVPPNVTTYGFLQQDEYTGILGGCDVGLSTLTFYRKGLRQAASLKVREYLARGLPVILAHEDVVVPEPPPEFILRVPDAPDNVETHVAEIVEFSQRMRGRRVEHEEIRGMVDSGYWERQRLDFFKKLLSS